MFKREIKQLSEGMAESIAKSINKLQYVEEKASRSADREEGDVKAQDISDEEPVKTDGSDTKAPMRKADKSGAESMEKVKEDVEVAELHMSLLEAHGIEKKVAERVKKVFDAMSDADKAAFMKAYLKNPKAATEYMFKDMKKMSEEVEELDENKNLMKDYQELKSQGKKDSAALDILMSMPKYKNMSKDKMIKMIGDMKRKGVFKEEVEIDEALDPVNKKAVKKDFEDRKDKDIDNDGDTDSSDEYLHKRRKAISKAMKKEEVDTSAEKKLEESITKMPHGRLKFHMNNKSVPHGSYSWDQMKAERDRRLKAGEGEAYKKAKMSMSEEIQLEEGYTINHKTFSSAVQHAKQQVEKQGYTIDDDEWDRKVATGPKKPGKGKTNRYTIDLMKGGKETRRKLQMQVYYDEGRYELNMYIS